MTIRALSALALAMVFPLSASQAFAAGEVADMEGVLRAADNNPPQKQEKQPVAPQASNQVASQIIVNLDTSGAITQVIVAKPVPATPLAATQGSTTGSSASGSKAGTENEKPKMLEPRNTPTPKNDVEVEPKPEEPAELEHQQ